MTVTTQILRPAALARRISSTVARTEALLARFPTSVTQLALRIAVAVPFWRSGLTKWDGWFELSDSASYLFEEEFRIHLFGAEYAYALPQLTAYVSSAAEIVLPIMLVVGLGTRFAALGILIMTAMIQLTVPEAWHSHHLPWAAMALAILTHGPGKLSADHLLSRRNAPR